jgi:hypothetical protein
MAAFENYGHNIHFCGHLCVHVRGHFTAAAVASGAPIWQAVWRRDYVKFGSPEAQSVANKRVNQSVPDGVLSWCTHGNFPLEMNELVMERSRPLLAALGEA